MTIASPLESAEQQAVITWARDIATLKYKAHIIQLPDGPRFPLLSIPNEGKRSGRTGARMVATGLIKGVPDMLLPIPIDKYSGLFIEMKRQKKAKIYPTVSPHQTAWWIFLNAMGYKSVICYGAVQAIEEITRYMEGE